MGILFRKKKVYFFASAAVAALICLLGGILIVDGKNYSVFNVIWELPQSAFQNYGVKEVFDIGTTGWLYILIPVVSVPFASYFSDERKSKFYLYLKGRQGTLHYLCSRCLYALCSSAAVLFTAIGSYSRRCGNGQRSGALFSYCGEDAIPVSLQYSDVSCHCISDLSIQ